MKRGRRTPLQVDWKSVECISLANGNIIVVPTWHGPKWTPEDGGGPGVFTRVGAARRLQRLINAHLKGKK